MQVTVATHRVGFKAASDSYGITLPQIRNESKSGIYPRNRNFHKIYSRHVTKIKWSFDSFWAT